MSTTPYDVHVEVTKHSDDAGDEWFYTVTINRHQIMAGVRQTPGGAKRAASAQLLQLKRDIEKALKTL